MTSKKFILNIIFSVIWNLMSLWVTFRRFNKTNYGFNIQEHFFVYLIVLAPHCESKFETMLLKMALAPPKSRQGLKDNDPGSIHDWGTTFVTKEPRSMSHWISTFYYDLLLFS